MEISNNYYSSPNILIEPAAIVQIAAPAYSKEPFYLSISSLHPAQTRISFERVGEKMEKAKTKAVWDESQGKWIFRHDGGKSFLSLTDCLPVVKAPFGFIPADGHHDIRASIDLGAESVPVRIIADLSHLSYSEFWLQAEEEGWAYLYDANGNKTAPVERFEDLRDDPNREFANLTARKYALDGSSRGAEFPLWIKHDRDIPFIEFKIGDALRKKGLVFAGGEPSLEFVEKAREILLEARIDGLKVVPVRTHYTLLTHLSF